MAQVSVCIVNWNTREHLQQCLHSLQQHACGPDMEVLVVDNASTDGSADMMLDRYPQVRLFAMEENLGYAAGNNVALREANGQHLLLLNPDITVGPGAIATLSSFLDDHTRTGAVAPKLVHPDGSVQLTCRSFPDPDAIIYEALGLSRLFPSSRRFGKYRMSWWDYGDTRTVDQPMASALMLRREALDEIGLMDESFPIFFNDVDLCRRLWDAGWDVWFTSDAQMIHEGGAATRQVRRKMIRESHLSLLRYYRKHYRGRLCPVVYGAVVSIIWVGMQARMAASRLAGRR